jgi:hypothetical protein
MLGTSMSSSHDPYQALRHREFLWFLLGSAPLFMAAQIQSLVMGWQVYALTNDPLSLGLIGLAEANSVGCDHQRSRVRAGRFLILSGTW